MSGQNNNANWGNGSAEWPALYSQYLLRVANQSAKMLELYQEVMYCVAREELSPTILQDMQPSFAQSRGAAYNNHFAEITMRFFTDMVKIGTTYSDELSDLTMPGLREPAPPPPLLNISDPILWYQQLNEYVVQMNARAVRAYQALFEGVAAGDVTPGHLQEVASGYVEQRFPDYLRNLSVSYFNLLNGLNDLYTGYQQEFLEGVLATVDRQDQEAAFLLKLSAPLGEPATATLSLSNTTGAPTTIRCAASEIRRADGIGPAFTPEITITPDSFNLQPDDDATLAVTIFLDVEEFEVDVLYVGILLITGHGEPRFEVPLRIKAGPSQESSIPTSSE